MAADAVAPLVFITVGTERYPFARLVGWIDQWARSDVGRRARCFVQYGAGEPPESTEGADFLTFPEMREFLSRATAVVCHGGTGSVMLARTLGRRPIVVPRVKRYGENVDDHQVDFAVRLRGLGEAEMAESFDELRGLLDDAATGARAFTAAPNDAHVEEAVARFGFAVERLRPAGVLDARRRG